MSIILCCRVRSFASSSSSLIRCWRLEPSLETLYSVRNIVYALACSLFGVDIVEQHSDCTGCWTSAPEGTTLAILGRSWEVGWRSFSQQDAGLCNGGSSHWGFPTSVVINACNRKYHTQGRKWRKMVPTRCERRERLVPGKNDLEISKGTWSVLPQWRQAVQFVTDENFKLLLCTIGFLMWIFIISKITVLLRFFFFVSLYGWKIIEFNLCLKRIIRNFYCYQNCTLSSVSYLVVHLNYCEFI